MNKQKNLEQIAQETVLYAIKYNSDNTCFFGPQDKKTIFYKTYEKIYKEDPQSGVEFVRILKDAYEIPLMID